MKKTYINPETSIVLLTMHTMIAGSPDGFNKELDNSDENAITPDQMLSREKQRSVWEEEEEW